ncbi:hypothetical protein [Lentzea atacamensis]|uniref:hypothetical protein n=1 Tax=Lentzea atacamensis TaxID=531938 RepID=UPI0011B51457|nr:hypothetical protein [Lentzea atacamensis]
MAELQGELAGMAASRVLAVADLPPGTVRGTTAGAGFGQVITADGERGIRGGATGRMWAGVLV